LRAAHVSDDAGTYMVKGSGDFKNLSTMGFFTPGDAIVRFPDSLAPTGGSKPCMTYFGGKGGVAATQYKGMYRVLNFGFPIENIDTLEDRKALLGAALKFFAR